MRPKKQDSTTQELLEPLLVNIIDMKHPLIQLADKIDWEYFEKEFGSLYHRNDGRPGIPMRMMVGFHYLKYTYNLSDEDVVHGWKENPYWQYFTGEKVFQTKVPINPTSMTRFRNRLKEEDLLKFLEETINTAFRSGYLNKNDVKKVAADTTVQEKNITFPTDIKLFYTMIKYLVKFSKKHEIRLKETHEYSGKKLLMKYSGYVHAKQYKRAGKAVKKMKTKMGKLYRSIERVLPEELRNSDEFQQLKLFYESLWNRSKKSKNKLYSLHSPEVECISKGKSHKRYEFGNKVGFVGTLKKNFILSCKSFHGNPYDGHTLEENLCEAKTLLGSNGTIDTILVDLGYRKHNYRGDAKVHVVPRSMKKFKVNFKRLLKRRSCVEATIGHTKRDNRMDRNYLKGKEGDKANAILAASGHNLRLILAFLLFFLKKFMDNIAKKLANFANEVFLNKKYAKKYV
ncbi:transposase IS4 family protein [Flexistipes sinusarabici DSM 4947]|uniref:Transposase IS4 family protein n=1 Tax=Flexistipes sinusarabici (strain ATCC 49648 / DSM 4947 / MAS 10) TaxID=717231 RepID=F8E5X3_FLESM|nr:IS5 family transposase [Flexistipes sinusarabici]AEI15814.1 transposase IS4 family protein [Flexistipes sinusarabici DSM 4947]